MGYTTDFRGALDIIPRPTESITNFVNELARTRRMKRNVDEQFGIEGEFYTHGSGYAGQDREDNVTNGNLAPSTQPSLWLQWVINENGMLEWDGGEKFYNYTEWLLYLIHKVFKPNGYMLNGTIQWRGEDFNDNGNIVVIDNVVYVNDILLKPYSEMRLDIVWKEESSQMSPDDIKDLAVKIVGDLVLNGLVKDCTDTNDETEFEFQDTISDTLFKHFKIKRE